MGDEAIGLVGLVPRTKTKTNLKDKQKMKNRITKLMVSVLAVLTLACFTAQAASSFAGPTPIIGSSFLGATNVCTNGLYPTGIGPGNVTVTNIIYLGTVPKENVAIQFTAAANGSSTTNAVVQIYCATTPAALNVNTNGGSTLGYTNAASTPLQSFATITLPLSGTTPVATNACYSPNIAPLKANGLGLYLYSVGMGAGTVSLTNYSVSVMPSAN
jgi:hypothetical protein